MPIFVALAVCDWPCHQFGRVRLFADLGGFDLKPPAQSSSSHPPDKPHFCLFSLSCQPLHPFTLHQYQLSRLLPCIFPCLGVAQATTFKQDIKARSKDLVTPMKVCIYSGSLKATILLPPPHHCPPPPLAVHPSIGPSFPSFLLRHLLQPEV